MPNAKKEKTISTNNNNYMDKEIEKPKLSEIHYNKVQKSF